MGGGSWRLAPLGLLRRGPRARLGEADRIGENRQEQAATSFLRLGTPTVQYYEIARKVDQFSNRPPSSSSGFWIPPRSPAIIFPMKRPFF
jgi:hypothetical protein